MDGTHPPQGTGGERGPERGRHRRPRRPRTGTEPVTARSPLRLRMLLSGIFCPVFAAGAVGFSLASRDPGGGSSALYAVLGAVCAALALIALGDIIVVSRRMRADR